MELCFDVCKIGEGINQLIGAYKTCYVNVVATEWLGMNLECENIWKKCENNSNNRINENVDENFTAE